MNVAVHLHTILQRQTPEGLVRQLELSVPPQSTVSDLLAQLEIDFPLDSLLLVVNGRLVEEDHILAEGDKVAALERLLAGEEFRSAIVFLRTKRRAKSLAQRLDSRGHRAVPHQNPEQR